MSVHIRIEAVQLEMGLMRQDIDKLRSLVSETEHRVSATEDKVSEHSFTLCTIQSKIKALEYKVDDAENRNRRNNL